MSNGKYVLRNYQTTHKPLFHIWYWPHLSRKTYGTHVYCLSTTIKCIYIYIYMYMYVCINLYIVTFYYIYICYDLYKFKKDKFDLNKAKRVFGYSILYLFLIFVLFLIDSLI